MSTFSSVKMCRVGIYLYGLVIMMLCAFPEQYTYAKEITVEDAIVWRYTVRPDDNLITLGNTYLINSDDWKVLQRINKIKDPDIIPAGSVLRIPVTLLKQGPATAEVIMVSGYTKLQKANNVFQDLVVGLKLGAGARLITKDNSKVVLRFADGSETTLTSNSTLVLDTLSIYSGGAMVDTKLRLQQGQVETHANPNHVPGNKMQIITPSAIAAVRGTKFRVSADAVSVKQETLDGEVGLAALGQEISVTKGYGSLAEKGKPPIQPVALLPAVDVAQLKTQHISLPVSFDMPALEGAVGWTGKVSPDQQFNTVVAEAETKGGQLMFTGLPDGKYYLSVRASDKHGLAGYDAIKQFNVNVLPLAPVLIYPELGSTVRNAQPKLEWSVAVDANTYLLEIAQDVGFKKKVVRQRVDASIYKVKKALVPGQYFWRVASIGRTSDGADEQSSFASTIEFTYKALPPMPDISQLQVNVMNNRVFVTLVDPLDDLTYEVHLNNKVNNQTDVWVGKGLAGQFYFPLKEYGPQTLLIKHTDSDGVAGPVAIYEFDAYP